MTKILLVNVDRAALVTLRLALQSEQCGFIQATTGNSALQAVREQQPDLVLLNVNLPDMDGLEVCRQIKAQPALIVPFIAILTSTDTTEANRVQGLEAGADDYIVQPISDRELLARVKALLRIRAAENALRQSEDKFKYIFENSVNPKSITLVSGGLNPNQALCDLLGYSAEELQHLTWQEITHPDDLELTQNEIEALLSNQKASSRFRKRYLHKNGAIIYADLVTSLRRDLNGTPLYFITSIHDISFQLLAEQSLNASNNYLQAVLDSITDAIFVTDADTGRIVDINRSMCEMYGYSYEETLNTNAIGGLSQGEPPYSRTELLAWLQKARQEGPQTFEWLARRKDGTLFWIDLSIRFILLQGQNRFLLAARDISERKRSQDELLQYKTLLETAGRVARFGGWMVNLIENKTTWSDQVVAIHEVPRGYAPSIEDGIRFYAPEWQEKITYLFNQCAQAGIPYDEELEIITSTGKRVWVRTTGQAIYDSAGAIVGMQGSFQDINERKHNEQAQRESAQRLQAIIDNAPFGAYSYELFSDDRLVFVGYNEAADKIIKIQHAGFIGKTIEEAFPGLANTPIPEMYRRTARQGIDFDDEQISYFEGQIAGVFEVHAFQTAANRMTVFFRDITERKQAEEKILAMNAELEARVEQRARQLQEAQERLVRQERLAVLGQLAGGVGHELRTPLGVISNAVYFLNLVQPDANEKVKEYLALIKEETYKAEKIISDLLDFARVKAITQEVVDVPKLVSNVLSRFPVPAHVQLILHLPDGLPPIFADPRHMEQVLGNLVVNACQAMPAGGTLTISAQQQDAEISIAVQDTGTGISPENLPKLFEPLFTTKPKGIGLGLPICKNLIEANHGHIEVHSELGHGATFRLVLPGVKAAP